MPDDPKIRFRLSATAREVVAAIEAAIVWHPEIAQIRDLAIRLAMRTGDVRWPGGFIVSGEPGTGKDTVIEAVKTALDTPNLLQGSSLPLLVVHVDSSPTDSSMITQLLSALSYVFAKSGDTTATERRTRLINGLNECGVKLILFNEYQHTVENDRMKMGKNISDLLKGIYEKTRIPMGFFGTPVIERVETVNDQFAGRFSGRFSLKPFQLDAAFQGVLKGFESQIPYFEPVGLWQKRYARPIHRACGGVMRLLKELLVETAIVALERGARQLSIEHFADAYRRKRGVAAWSGSLMNPFERRAA